MEKPISFKNVLTAFANYGFQKTSMDDLARAAGVSRQTLYNRYKTKQAVLDWAVSGYVAERLQRAQAHLKMPNQSVGDRLVMFYKEWMGELAPLLHSTPHGGEIMDLSTDKLERDGIDSHADYERAVADFLADFGLYSDPANAREMAFLLTMAAKGLLFKFATVEEFEAGMQRIVRLALRSTRA